MTVYCAGGLTLDWIRRDGRDHGPNLGGNAAYAAVGARLAGVGSEVVAVLGADCPDELLKQLEAAGIGVGHSRRVETASFRVLLDDSTPDRRITYLPGSGTNAELDPLPDQLPDVLGQDAVHICAIPTPSQRAIIDAVSRPTVVTLDTVHIPGQIEPTPAELLELARRVDTFLPSQQEAERFWPGDPEAALRTLSDSGVTRAVVKLGAAGSIGIQDDAMIMVPAAPASVVDTTGAGDAYCGAYCAARARGDGVGESMAWGSAAASVIVEGYGFGQGLTDAGLEMARSRFDQVIQHMKMLATA